MRYLITILFTCCTISMAQAQNKGKTNHQTLKITIPSPAKQTITHFYQWVINHPNTGIPTINEHQILKTTLAPKLAQLIQQAKALEAKCITRTTENNKPYIIEGNIFVANYEGAKKIISYGEALQTKNTIKLNLKLTNQEASSGIQWTDRIELIANKKTWQIADIAYAIEQKDTPPYSLARGLKEYIDEASQLCQ